MTQPAPIPVRAKDRKWLSEIVGRTQRWSGMYPGIQQSVIPDGPAGRLHRSGLIEDYQPHNPVHALRWIATDAGRAEVARQIADPCDPPHIAVVATESRERFGMCPPMSRQLGEAAARKAKAGE